MIRVTRRTKEKLKEILDSVDEGQDVGLRLLPRPDDAFVLAVSKQLTGDQVVEYQGSKVLFIGMEYFRYLDGKTMDCYDMNKGTVLVLR